MNDNEQLPIILAMESKHLILRPITLDDAHGLFNYAKDELWQNLFLDNPIKLLLIVLSS